jgi:hypothetical protein
MPKRDKLTSFPVTRVLGEKYHVIFRQHLWQMCNMERETFIMDRLCIKLSIKLSYCNYLNIKPGESNNHIILHNKPSLLSPPPTPQFINSPTSNSHTLQPHMSSPKTLRSRVMRVKIMSRPVRHIRIESPRLREQLSCLIRVRAWAYTTTSYALGEISNAIEDLIVAAC